MSIQTIAKRDTNEEITQVNFRLPKTLLAKLKEVATFESVSQTLIVDAAIRAKLNEYNKTKQLNLEVAE